MENVTYNYKRPADHQFNEDFAQSNKLFEFTPQIKAHCDVFKDDLKTNELFVRSISSGLLNYHISTTVIFQFRQESARNA